MKLIVGHVPTLVMMGCVAVASADMRPAMAQPFRPIATAVDGAGFPAPYCDWYSPGVSPITRVRFGGFDNDSDPDYNNSPALENFTLIVGEVDAGDSEPINVRARTWSDIDPVTSIAAFADWNQDNDFDDAFESRIYANIYGPGIGRTIELSSFLDIPNTAREGITRLRVVALDNGSISSCFNGAGGGQAEDYTLNVHSEYIFANGFD